MNPLEFCWSTASAIAGKDHQALRVVLDEQLTYPRLGQDKRGFVLLLPLPKDEGSDLYALHGLYFDADEASWPQIWRLFKASLYHLSLHAAFSDFSLYVRWARGKEPNAATFCASLVEDYRVTLLGTTRWGGILEDIAYANYIAGLRARDLQELDEPHAFALSLLLELWGVLSPSQGAKLDGEVRGLAEAVRRLVQLSLEDEDVPSCLQQAAQLVYNALGKRGRLREVPFLPHTEEHGPCTLFEDKLVEKDKNGHALLLSAYDALRLIPPGQEEATRQELEAREFFLTLQARQERREAIRRRYSPLLLPTRLQGLSFPRSDYAMYLRTRSSLAGPIRTIREQLKQIRSALEEREVVEEGHVDLQRAVQALASQKPKKEFFTWQEPLRKDEAWAILLDASKSLAPLAQEVRGIATCLAEVAQDVMPSSDRWALYAFNSSLLVLKDFDEEYDLESRARIGGLTQGSSTLLPDAIEVCSRALAARPAEARILVVASDGYAVGYEGIEQRLEASLKKAGKMGLLLLGIGIASRRLENYFLINCPLQEPYQLMKYFVKSYFQLSSLF